MKHDMSSIDFICNLRTSTGFGRGIRHWIINYLQILAVEQFKKWEADFRTRFVQVWVTGTNGLNSYSSLLLAVVLRD